MELPIGAIEVCHRALDDRQVISRSGGKKPRVEVASFERWLMFEI